jgi:hypothetical protein
MFFLDKKIVDDHQYGKPGYRYIGCETIHTYHKDDKNSQKRALMRANNDKKYYERKQPVAQKYIPLRVYLWRNEL